MGQADYYAPGRWNAICDRCGFKYKSNQIRQEWTGLRVCSGPNTNDCWEARHPQDYLRGKRDRQAPPWTRPDRPDDILLLEDGTPLLLEGGDTIELQGVPDRAEVTPDEL